MAKDKSPTENDEVARRDESNKQNKNKIMLVI